MELIAGQKRIFFECQFRHRPVPQAFFRNVPQSQTTPLLGVQLRNVFAHQDDAPLPGLQFPGKHPQ